jgi:hypothetical protein
MTDQDALRRNYVRIVALADAAYEEMLIGPTKLHEAAYKDWATLLLRYQSAMEGHDSDEPLLPSMKGQPVAVS